MDELLKVSVAGGSVALTLFLVLKIIQAARGFKNGTNNGSEKLLLGQIAANMAKVIEALVAHNQTILRLAETNERFTDLVSELAVMVRRGVDPEREVTQKVLNAVEGRLTQEIRNVRRK